MMHGLRRGRRFGRLRCSVLTGTREMVDQLQRNGWVVVRRYGDHVRLHRREGGGVVRLTLPVCEALRSSTLRRIVTRRVAWLPQGRGRHAVMLV